MGEYENLDPQEREEVDDIANSLCEDLFGEKEKKKGGWPKGKKRKAAVINQELEEMFREEGKIAPAQVVDEISVIPVAVREVLEDELEILEKTIQSLNREIEEKQAQIRKTEQKYKVIADYITKGD